MKNLLTIFFLFIFASCTNSIYPSVTKNYEPQVIAPQTSNTNLCGSNNNCTHAYNYKFKNSCGPEKKCNPSIEWELICVEEDNCINGEHHHIRQIE